MLTDQAIDFKEFQLRRIVKENHGAPIPNLKFNPITTNLVATVGSSQASIYDNEHCKDHLDLIANFDLLESTTLSCICWIPSSEDALLAVAGADTYVHVLSLSKSKEIYALQGHAEGNILELVNLVEGFLLSASTDGTLRIWYLPEMKCVKVINVFATSACFNGVDKIVIGTPSGDIIQYSIPSDLFANPLTSTAEVQEHTQEKKFHGNSNIDCIQFVDAHNLLSKSENGKVVYWNLETSEVLQSYQIRGGSGNKCKFDISSDKQIFCIGNQQGIVMIYDLSTGGLVHSLEHKRINKSVGCCAFSRDMRNIVFTAGDGIIWRFDWISEELRLEWRS